MPIDLSNLAADEVTVVIFWSDDEAKVTYRPSALTTRTVEKMQAASEDEAEVFLDFLTKVMARWDVTAKKKKVPITIDALKDVPLTFLRAVVIGIMEDSGRGEVVRNSADG